ncbi:MFS transporter [Dongia deserti]|uniref:MFS transporter n=1 Tax=Dongia deserti TaxID=2268030 RepID=UPI000E650F6B|nr:MFS transporter [Dongia deserti]
MVTGTVGASESHHRTWWPGVALGVGVSCAGAFQQFKLPPVLPDLLRAHPHDPAVAAGFMSIYALVAVVVSQPLGRWLQDTGRPGHGRLGRGLALAGLVMALGGALALIWPDSSVLFLAGRGLEGLGFALCAIAGPAIAAQAAAPRDLPLVTGLLAGWIPIGQIIAALVAAPFPDWRVLWWLGIVLALGLALLGRRSAGALTRKTTAEEALTARQKKLLWLGGSIFLLWSGQYFAFMTWLTSYLEIRYGLSLRESVGAYLLPVVVLLGFNILTGWALGRGLPLLRALTLGLLSQAIVWMAAPFAEGWIGLALLLFYGIGAGIVPTCLFQVPHRIVGGAARAGAFGIVMAARNVGVFLGPLLLGVLIKGPEDWPLSFTIMTAVTLGATALAIALRWLLLRQS